MTELQLLQGARLDFVEPPGGSHAPGVLAGIGVADHALLLALDVRGVPGVAQQLLHRALAVVQVVQRLEQWGHPHRLLHPALALRSSERLRSLHTLVIMHSCLLLHVRHQELPSSCSALPSLYSRSALSVVSRGNAARISSLTRACAAAGRGMGRYRAQELAE